MRISDWSSDVCSSDLADVPYDGDRLSAALDERFSDLFGRPCAALWVATGTAANCLTLGTMVAPHGGVVCHEEAHIEADEGGAPGFYLHGAKLMLASGEGRSEEHTSELQSLMRISYAVFCLKK